YGTSPSGGGLSVRGFGVVDVIDSNISSNRADGDLLYSPSRTFFRPPATGVGGGIRFKAEVERDDGQLPDVLLSAVIDPTTISDNYASGDGGGIFVDSQGDASLSLQLDDVTLSGNTAFRNGGGLYVGDIGDSGGTATIAASGCNQDDFDTSDGAEPTSPRDGLAAEIANPNPLTGCDETGSNRVVLESLEFAEPEFAVDGAFLRIGMRPVSFATNDSINLFSTTWETGLTRDSYNIGSLADADWQPGNFPDGVEFDIPLSAEVLNDVMENRRLDIYVQDDTAVDFTELHLRTGIVVNRSTIDDNTATDGGGIWVQDAAFTVVNSTISGNTATGDGGGIWSSQPSTGETKVRFTTITNNSASGAFGGAGIRNVIGGFDLESSIVTDNSGSDIAPDLSDPTGAVVAEFTLVSNTTGSSITSTDGNIVGESADLLPLAFNGGPTRTHAPSATSPVVEGGNPEYKLAEDQRGYSRPGLRDMGPVESDGLPPEGLGDFNGDNAWDISDINALNAVIASGSNDLTYDMNGDGVVDQDDLRGPTGWLVVGGARNAGATGGSAFIVGDL
ncbi:MAG: choice-of-anchor Q domain-containing protein, partial [Planctomycetota bacterium]